MNVWEHVDPFKEAQHFCKIHKVESPVLVDADGSFISSLGIRGVPFNLVVNRKGNIQAAGVTTPDEIRSTLTRLLLPFG